MIECNNLRISLDRKEPNSDVDFISHAHTDHVGAIKSSKNVLASAETISLIEQVYSITAQKRAESCGLRLIEAGHMLGSRQLHVDNDASGIRTTYTGDFQTVGSKTSRPIEIIDTDILIMDSTYADSSVRFDDKLEVESAIQDWTLSRLKKGIVLFSAYAMGKAQELIAIFNEVGIKPVVSKKIEKTAAVYVNSGIRLDYCSAYNPQSDYGPIVSDNFVGITDSRNLAQLKSGLQSIHRRNVYTAVATGFAKSFRFNTDAQFPLSDHADFQQSIDYIEATHARKILTYGPNAPSFARNLGKSGYDSVPFGEFAISRQANNI